ncbi:hypothetical protein TrVE_jg5056 [Triparma verrucosa]|uniref:SGNH hydrolase-type esterase domain-containing protein n=1 Tax=Triparma verrucosa TaxID=1606542 RepID=A0A9W7ELT5_9STRA|nr:hypothetical protein TrVE_jg5056 [Triparma verrucosa]
MAASGLNQLFNLLAYLYVLLRRIFNASWIRANVWISQADRVIPKTNGPRHKVIVMGDSLAMGLGDWILAGQVAGVAPSILKAAALDKQVRQRWYCLNRGNAGSSSEDWLPPKGPRIEAGQPTTEKKGKKGDGEAEPLLGDDSPGGKSWERIFGPGRVGEDAEVVVIMLGLSDVVRGDAGLPLHAMKRDHNSASVLYPEDELAVVVKNVRSIAARLRSLGKKVAVVDLPISGAVVSSYGEGKVKRINRQLKQICKHNLSNVGDTSNPVAYVSLGLNHKVMRPEHRAFDSLHLNSKGYKVLGVEIYSAICPMLVNCEWKMWKQKLAGALPEHERVMKANAEELVGEGAAGAEEVVGGKVKSQ